MGIMVNISYSSLEQQMLITVVAEAKLSNKLVEVRMNNIDTLFLAEELDVSVEAYKKVSIGSAEINLIRLVNSNSSVRKNRIKVANLVEMDVFTEV